MDAGTEQTYHAVRALDPEKVAASVPFMRLMGQARALPARLAARHRGGGPPAPQSISPDQAREAFLPLDEQPGMEFVVGMIGKFMSATQLEFRRFEPAEFAGFTEPGFGKVAVGFLVLPYGASRSLLCAETRTATTDPVSARRFRTYWAVVGPFAGCIMRRWLMLAKQHAEQQASPEAAGAHWRSPRAGLIDQLLLPTRITRRPHCAGCTARVSAGSPAEA